MLHHKKIVVAIGILALTVVGMAATRPPEEGARNLKVLPKHISHDDLDKIMDSWKAALGVKCGFCHAASADSSSHRLDFASDAKPEKNIARSMYKMTGKINKKYFHFDKDEKGEAIAAITCMTCHRGSPHPDEVK